MSKQGRKRREGEGEISREGEEGRKKRRKERREEGERGRQEGRREKGKEETEGRGGGKERGNTCFHLVRHSECSAQTDHYYPVHLIHTPAGTSV